MPRYAYKCRKCDEVFTAFHLSTESLGDCLECKETDCLTKLLTEFSTKKPHGTPRTQVGETTETFIKDSRKELEQQKEELKRNRK